MPDFIQLSNVTAAEVWGAWEPVALFFLTAGAFAAILACLAARSEKKLALAHPGGIVALASGVAGQTSLLMGLEQPFRSYEFYLRPHFTSWTAWGAYLIPFFLLCVLVLAWRTREENRQPLTVILPALAAACLIFVYSGREIMDCIGRSLWARPLLPLTFLAAGFSAARGLLGFLLPGPQAPAKTTRPSTARGVLRGCAAGACLCAAAALLTGAPEGFAEYTTLWWRMPDAICCLAALAALAALVNLGRPRSLGLAGTLACLSAFMAVWKVIHMGQAFGRTTSSFSDAAAFLDLFSPGALLAVAGGAGLWLALAVILSFLFSGKSAPRFGGTAQSPSE